MAHCLSWAQSCFVLLDTSVAFCKHCSQRSAQLAPTSTANATRGRAMDRVTIDKRPGKPCVLKY